MHDFNYIRPTSLQEALSFLSHSDGEVCFLAGGTDLIPQIREGRKTPKWVMDVKSIPEMNRLELDSKGALHLGAAVPCADIVSSSEVGQRFALLKQTASLIGGFQIKNRASVGGNICNAAPSADTAPALLCLEAIAHIAVLSGMRKVPLEEFFQGPGRTNLTSKEFLIEIEVPPSPPRSAGCYLRMTPREEMDIAIVGVASHVVLNPRGNVCKEAHISLGAVAPTPKRAHKAEALLSGKALDAALIEQASRVAAQEAQPITDIRGSADYRRHLVEVLTHRTLISCLKSLKVDL